MAEDADEPTWRGGCLGCSGALLLLTAIVSIAISIDERGFDGSRRCADGRTGECISTTTGMVDSHGGALWELTVLHDDGRRRVDVDLQDRGAPAAGTRLLLEWWDGDLVAVVDRGSERRYRTTNWPDPWWEWALFVAAVAVLLGLALGVVFGIAAVVNRLWTVRRRSRTGSRGARGAARSRAGRAP